MKKNVESSSTMNPTSIPMSPKNAAQAVWGEFPFVTAQAVRALLRNGDLPYVKTSKGKKAHYRVKPSDVAAYYRRLIHK